MFSSTVWSNPPLESDQSFYTQMQHKIDHYKSTVNYNYIISVEMIRELASVKGERVLKILKLRLNDSVVLTV